jgi:integrase
MGKRRRASHTWTDPKTGNLYALYTYTDSQGKRRYIYRRAQNLTHARDLYRQMEAEFAAAGERIIDAARMTFSELANYYAEKYLQPPQYRNGVKIAGLRSWRDMRRKLRVLEEWFGKRRLRDITYGDIREFKEARLQQPTIHGSERTAASVHRELALLRKMLNVAVRERWLLYNPFQAGDALISSAIEVRRERVISYAEEERILAQCVGVRAHLRPLVITALDTGMRRGELLSLRWADIDFEHRTITIRSYNTKTATERTVMMTARVYQELMNLWNLSLKQRNALVFGLTDIKRSFHTACRLAGVDNVRFHDLRHTAATRLISQGMPIEEVALVLGHNQITTTYRYTNRTTQTIERAARLLTEWHLSSVEEKTERIN